ncbi:MAG TPA: serine/threonine dehydratase [Saprospiraceae bacterium]|nr:serine/threonine dehydratase [Saprospiraceae bacterium]HNT21530.1 serine/threonine dehydratase [Saprospiraceae bacterium]
MKFLSIEDISKANERVASLVHKTPIFTSSLLNQWMGHELYFKAECMQKIGAFKARGACNTVAWLLENNEKPKHIVANSSGNHAQAVAWAASRFGIPSTIFMPAYSSKVKIQATKSYGAEVILCETRAVVDEKVKLASEEEGTCWIPPFNHDQVIAGQGTAAYEAIEEVGEVDGVFAPCGGGGLLSGTWVASRGLAPKASVIGAEPLNANDAAQSLRMNSIQKLQSVPDTLADGAMTIAVGDLTFEYLKQLDDFYEIEESRIRYWTQWLTHLLKVRVEPTSAMAMEAAFRWLSKQTSKKRALVILSGGNIDQETSLKIWKDNCLDEVPRL